MFKTSRKIYITLFVLLIFLAAGILALKFSNDLKGTLESMQYQTLKEAAYYNNQTITAKTSQLDKILEMVAENVPYYRNKSTEELSAFLKTTAECGAFDRIGVTDTEGNVIFSDDTSGNIAHRWYFKKALSGSKSIEGPLISVVSGNPIVVFATPIREGQTITGIVHGTYELQNAGASLLKSDHDTIVTNSTGEILFYNMHNFSQPHSNEESKTIFSMINENTIIDGHTADSLLLELACRNSGTFEFMHEDQKNYAFFSPVGINDWYAFQLIPDSGLLAAESLFNKIAMSMVVSYIILLCIVFLILFFLWRSEEKKVKNRITAEKERYFNLLSRIQGGVVILKYINDAENSSVVYLNNVFKNMIGYTEKEIAEQFNNDITNLIHPDDDPQKIRNQHKTFDIDKSYQLQYRLLKKDGSYVWVMELGYIYLNNQGERVNQILFSDIDILKQHETELQLNAESMRIATNLISGGVFEYDIIQNKFILFESIDKIIGVKNKYIFEEYQKKTDKKVISLFAFLYFVHPQDRSDAIAAYNKLLKEGNVTFQARLNKNDIYIWGKFHLTLVCDAENKPMRIIGNILDINDTKCQMDQLQNIADHDPLTGILNRQAFVMGVERVLNSYPENTHAFFLLDIDNFKGINDNYGHAFGDFVLKNLAKSLVEIFEDSDLVGRIGGDEFVVFMTNVEDIQKIHYRASQICNLYKTVVTDGEKEAVVSYSVGISLYDKIDRKNRSTLYLQADSALYESKENGKNRYTFYTNTEN